MDRRIGKHSAWGKVQELCLKFEQLRARGWLQLHFHIHRCGCTARTCCFGNKVLGSCSRGGDRRWDADQRLCRRCCNCRARLPRRCLLVSGSRIALLHWLDRTTATYRDNSATAACHPAEAGWLRRMVCSAALAAVARGRSGGVHRRRWLVALALPLAIAFAFAFQRPSPARAGRRERTRPCRGGHRGGHGFHHLGHAQDHCLLLLLLSASRKKVFGTTNPCLLRFGALPSHGSRTKYWWAG